MTLPAPPPDEGVGALSDYGWRDDVAVRAAGLDGTPARVVRVDRLGVMVATPSSGVIRAMPPRDLEPVPVAGDWVTLGEGDPRPVTAVATRAGELVRADPAGGLQVLAANLDVVALTVRADRRPKPGWIERAMAVVLDAEAEPVVVLTKADLAEDPEGLLADALASAPRARGIITSAVTGRGLDEVRALAAPDRTVAMLGESGAGKSRIVNALVGSDVQVVGAVRDRDAKGRHTTTSRTLIPLPGGGVLLDSPGIRELGVGVAEAGVAEAFADVMELAESCHFSDCAHVGEPGCAVAAAIEDGVLTARRVERWRELVAEAAAIGARRDAVALRKRRGEASASRGSRPGRR